MAKITFEIRDKEKKVLCRFKSEPYAIEQLKEYLECDQYYRMIGLHIVKVILVEEILKIT